MSKGRLFVISGPSGTGKGTICKGLTEFVEAELSVSMTTREPRSGEEEGISYYFVSESEFNVIREENGFLEHAVVYDCFYGTPRGPVEKALHAGTDVILEIDMQGAMQIKENFGDGVYIFILPPSMSELRNRIKRRGTESPEAIELRMSRAIKELEYLEEYDYYVINEDINEAINDVANIMRAEHLKISGDIEQLKRKYKEEL